MSHEIQRDVLLSVKPGYANLIVDGLKTVELRRRFPSQLEPGTRCLIYATAPVQKVIGECKIAEVVQLGLNDLWKESSDKTMVPWSDFISYFTGLTSGYVVKLYGHIRYESPLMLSSVAGTEIKAPRSFRYISYHS